MRLADAEEGQVVRNVRNGSHYRYDRLEKSRCRIRPLELFPNGLLIPKPTDTIVSPDLEVQLIGNWTEGMTVEGKPSHSRANYERELAACRLSLIQLESGYAELPISGRGKLSRGSWANKTKNCLLRIDVLERGLAEHTAARVAVANSKADRLVRKGQTVLLPSGYSAQVKSVRGNMAMFSITFRGECLTGELPCDAVRPMNHAFNAKC